MRLVQKHDHRLIFESADPSTIKKVPTDDIHQDFTGMMLNPKIILVDEPTEGLAPKIVTQIAELLVDVARSGTGILLIEQKLVVALDVSSCVFVMGHGKVVFTGSPVELRKSPDISCQWLAI